MIWYLLYPLRRTTTPATIGEDHFLRRWICYLGAIVARHAWVTIIISVAIGVALSVPVPFLYHPTPSSSSTRQTYAWIPAETSAGMGNLVPEISIKQAWIYGSRMKALERDSILEALAIQELLLGPISSCATTPWLEDNIRQTLAGTEVPEVGAAVSFVHSPLLYWNCSKEAIESDTSIIATVNRGAHQVSPANVTLRPLSVLAGTAFSSNKVVAADALVVSLIYGVESKAGDLWDLGADELAQYDKSRWEVYPAAGRGVRSTIFRAQSHSTDFQEKAIFSSVYGLIALYVIFKLWNVNVTKSRVTLFIVIALQTFLSILSGLTVASLLQIDISKIPPEACPLIVLVVGVENMFRLLSAVEKTSLQDQSANRVATALGAGGHISLIAVAQTLIILGLLSSIASLELAAFCEFAAVAIIIDLAFLSTFFVAILKVSLSDYGLEDSFKDVSQRPENSVSPKVWTTNQLPQPPGRYSKRHARQSGLPYQFVMIVVVIIFLISVIANYYFAGNLRFYFARMFAVLFKESGFTNSGHPGYNDNSVLQKLGGTMEWLSMLDQETTKEILHFNNPRSNGFLVRLYDPLVIQLKLVNTTQSPDGNVIVSSPIETLLFGYFDPSVLVLSFVLVLSLVIRKCSRTNNASDETEDRTSTRKAVSTVNYLPRGHTLDVFMLAASSKQYLVSVGFDHEIRAWNLDSQNISSQLIRPVSTQHVLWPAAAIAVDDKAEWIAICSKANGVSLWNIKLQCFRRSVILNHDSRIVSCFFTPSSHQLGSRLATSLLIVFGSGLLVDIDVETGVVLRHQISTNPIRSSHISSHRRLPLRLITVSEGEKINITVKREHSWTSQVLQFSIPILKSPARLRFTVIPDLRMVGLVLNMDTRQLHLIDFLSGAAIYTFCQSSFKHRTLRAIHSHPQQCLSCGAVALSSFSIAYTTELEGSFTMCTLIADQTPRNRTGLVCLRAERDLRERRCVGFASGTEKTYSIPDAGVWETTAANGVAGVRRKRPNPKAIPDAFTQDHPRFRRRESTLQRESGVEEGWEAWTMTATGVVNIHPISSSLFAGKVGPLCSIGRNAIAVGLAEGIALVQFGSQLHDNDDDDDDNVSVRRLPRARLAGRSKSGPWGGTGI